MADKEADQQLQTTSSSWWGSWIDTAKSKSASVLEAVKKDLGELSEVVKTEASAATAVFDRSLGLSEGESTVGSMKKSFSSFLGSVSEALSPTIDDDDSETVMITNNDLVTLTGFKRHLAELQTNDSTYLEEPVEELQENYKRWLEVIEQDQFTEPRLTKQLNNSQILNEKYTTLVPDKVVHMEFWKRYLFKKALLEDALANAEIAEKRAKAEAQSTKTVSPKKQIVQTEQPKAVLGDEATESEFDELENEAELEQPIQWKTDDFSAANLELSEEEQARLLEEYEQEIKDREKGKAEKADEAIADELLEIEKKRNDKAAVKVNTTQKNANKKTNQPTAKNSAKKETGKTKTTAPQTKQQPQKQTNKQKPQPTTDSKTPAKQDGTALPIEKDHFTKDEVSSSNSDESWEKDFEVEDK